MKPAILVTSHPNNEKKEQMVREFGNFISQYDIDHYLFTNYPASKLTQQEYKEAHFVNFNPKDPCGNQWRTWMAFGQTKLKHHHLIENWCLSGTHLMLKGLKYLQSLGYTHVYTFIYDTNPIFSEIKNFIELSNQAIFKDKKAVFYEYPELEVKIESQITKRKGLHNHIYSGEINFLIKIFQESTDNYSPSNPFLQQNSVSCESYWRHSFKPYEDKILYLPDSQVIKSIYESAAFSKLPSGHTFVIGRYNDKTLFTTLTGIFEFSLLDSEGNKVKYNIIYQDNNLTAFEFDSVIGKSYYINDFKILTDTQNWRNTDFYTNN